VNGVERELDWDLACTMTEFMDKYELKVGSDTFRKRFKSKPNSSAPMHDAFTNGVSAPMLTIVFKVQWAPASMEKCCQGHHHGRAF
jgi:hypothetical protein